MLKRWIFIVGALLSYKANAQLLFSETFEGESDGDVTGVEDLGGVAWEATCPECLDAGDFFEVQGGELVGQDTNGHAIWESESIDISSCDFIQIELDLFEEGTMEACETGCNSVDYVMLEYNIDGTGWLAPDDATFCGGACADVMVIQSDDIPGGFMHYMTSCIEGGVTLQLRITVQAWAASERWIIDNIEVSCTEGPSINAGEDQTVCEGTEVTLEAENPDDADLSWSDGVIDGVSFTPGVGAEGYVVSATADGCTATDTVLVTVLENPDVTVEPAGPFSTTSGLQTMEATPEPGVWTADCGTCIDPVTGEFDPEVAGAGTWEICYTAGDDPCFDTECIEVIVTDGECMLDGTISFNTPTCFGFTDGSVTINMTGITGDIIYVITDEDGTVVNEDNSNTANTLGEGWYYFNVTDEFPCEFIDSVFLDDPDQIIIDLEVSHPLCYGDSTGFAFVDSVYNTTGDYSAVVYNWTPNYNGDNGVGEDSLFSAPAGEYTLTINDENGCTRVEDFELIYPDSLYFGELGYHSAYCRLYDYQKGNGVVFAAANGGTPDYNYEWENLTTGETEDNTTWGGLNPGDYQITFVDENGCVLSAVIAVDSLNPIAEFDMTAPQFTTPWKGTAPVEVNFVNQSANFANPFDPVADTVFFWDFGLSEGSVLSEDLFETFDRTYYQEGDYEVCLVATNKNGCQDSTCKVITVFDPFTFVPVNIFTPNGDGHNDVFTFNGFAKSVDSFECVIVNRWGKEIMTLTAIEEGWDGVLKNGSEATAGVYFYVYSGKMDNGTKFEGQGNFQLVR